MHACLELLEPALDIGELELQYLTAGQVDGVEELSERRFNLLDEAWDRQSEDCLDEFREKFIAMQDLQVRLSDAAVRLHEVLRDELKKNRQENTRRSSYQQTSSLDLYNQVPLLMSRMG